MMWLVLLWAAVVAGAHPPLMACTYDIEAPNPLAALGHFVINATGATFDVDVPYKDYAVMVSSSPMGAWTYVATTALSSGYYVAVYDLLSRKTLSGPKALDTTSLNAFKCTSHVCYGIDVNNARVITVDPWTGAVQTLLTYGLNTYIGITEGASALDAEDLALYAILINPSTQGVLVKIDLVRKTITPLPPSPFNRLPHPLLHYATLHSTPLHSTPRQYTTRHDRTRHNTTTLHDTTRQHYTTHTTLHYTALRYTTLHYTTRRYPTLVRSCLSKS
jgi:hypothetical protein